jgi:hypothetical protein
MTHTSGASGQHMAEFVAIAEVDSETGVKVDAAAGAGAEVGTEVVREAAG